MAAISRSKVKIWVQPAGTAPSTLLATTTYNGSNLGYISGQIKSYSKSGGETDVESDPVFGGFVDKEKPASQVELSFEIVPDLTTNPDIWDSFIYGTNALGVYVMGKEVTDRAVFIQAAESGGQKSWAFNNCGAISWDVEHNADDNQSGTFTFKFSPTTDQGISNYMSKNLNVTALPAWTTLTA
jgi:hypothetical protein